MAESTGSLLIKYFFKLIYYTIWNKPLHLSPGQQYSQSHASVKLTDMSAKYAQHNFTL